MSKRFTDSEKFRDTWYRKLTPVQKCIWEYMLSECNIAGILNFDLDAISFHVGAKITEKDLVPFENKVFFIKSDVVFIPAFVVFQNGKQLNPNNSAHKTIIKILEENGIDSVTLSLKNKEINTEGQPTLIGGVEEGQPSYGVSVSNSNIYNNINNNISKNTKNESNSLGSTHARDETDRLFAEFYAEYPLKKSKKAAQKKFSEIIKGKKVSFEELMSSLRAYNEEIAVKGTEKRFIKHPSTWLNQECWTDDCEIDKPPKLTEEQKQRESDERLKLINQMLGEDDEEL